MRGKKVDSNFVSQFITECVIIGKNSSEDILNIAKNKISEIDQKIIEVEELKKIRAQIMGVVVLFENETKKSNIQEIKNLEFFKIKNIHISKRFCDDINQSPLNLQVIKTYPFDKQDVLFTMKQLIEHKVIARVGDHLIKSDEFNEYVKCVFKS